MKKILTVLLIMVMIIGTFTSCFSTPTPSVPSDSDKVTEDTGKQSEQSGEKDESGENDKKEPADSEDADKNENENDGAEDDKEVEDKEEDTCDHEGGEDATCLTESICDICDKPYGGVDSGNHEGEEAWEASETSHKLIYSCCGAEIDDEAEHEFVNGVCSVCEYECEHKSNDGHSCIACGAFVAHNYKNGQCIECLLTRNGKKVTLGSYPQSKVTTTSLISTLNAGATWTSKDGKWYADVENGNNKYRGVRTTQNGTATWFKYDPVQWTIIDENDGKALILCDMIIHAMAYSATKNNSYEESAIRAWLNDDFLNTAFNQMQKEIIIITEVDNGKASTGYVTPRFEGENTFDKIFLLSRAEVKKADYGFSTDGTIQDTARKKKATAYAIAQMNGAYDATNGAWWWLRTPAPHTTDTTRADLAHNIKVNGTLNNSVVDTGTAGGVLPAMWINI